jgi:methylmalonyl-CoA mutase
MAGADAADELAAALSTGAAYLEQLLHQGFQLAAAAKHVAFQVSVGRDTFAELAKVRALRVCWQKVLAAAGLSSTGSDRTVIHAVCSTRTLTQNDPWVNMLRGTTQVFAAVLGGADLVTPLPFDRALGTVSDLAQRVARNTGLVLREESSLGKVADPAAGSYYLETLTDQLAREAWKRFQLFEREGGAPAMRAAGKLAARFEASWRARLADVARRKAPVLGVSECANVDEKLPSTPKAVPELGHRESEAFEPLRAGAAGEVALVTLGSFSESRARAGFAANLFSAGGFKTRETSEDPRGGIACLCGTDDRYAAEAVARAKSLKANGVKKVLLAGKPGTLEAALREAGVDAFIFLGCDVVATLAEVRS